jgi:4-amino-4-deoxy-L-arabinose transferase-like glycosyltransferase
MVCISITLYRCFFDLGTLPVERWDEKTNIRVINSITSRQSFPALTLDGAPFFEKPPVWYWVVSAINLPVHNPLIAARGVSALCGFLSVMCIVWASRHWWGDTAGVVSWAVLATTQHLFVNNPEGIFSTHTLRSADVDSLFILFLVLSFIASLSVENPRHKGLVTGLFCALATLTKGPLGLLPFIFLPKKSMHSALAIYIFFLLPWYTYMTVIYGWSFISTHIFYHLIQRSLYPIEGHMNPWWYYISLLTRRTVFLSWEVLGISIMGLIITGRYTADRRVRAGIIMLLLCLIIPTAAQTRLAWYILPAYPFAALTIGAFASLFLQRIQKIRL